MMYIEFNDMDELNICKFFNSIGVFIFIEYLLLLFYQLYNIIIIKHIQDNLNVD
jgi:hypothetical protein